MTGRPLDDLREDAERIAAWRGEYALDDGEGFGAARHLARQVLSLLDAQSGMEEALRAAGKALACAPIADPGEVESDQYVIWCNNDRRSALASVNAVLAGKNTEKAEVRHLTLDEQRTFEAALRKSGTIVAVAKPLSTSALDEERALLDELTLYGGRLDPGGAPAAASNWITRRDALLARLSANPKGPKE